MFNFNKFLIFDSQNAYDLSMKKNYSNPKIYAAVLYNYKTKEIFFKL